MPSLIAHTRLFVTLTLEEAAAVVRLPPGADPDAGHALAKIRSALEGATRPPSAPAPLRAKEYRMAKAGLPAPPPGPPSSPVTRRRDTSGAGTALSPEPSARCPEPRMLCAGKGQPNPDDDYVPYRDEAGGIHR